MAKQNCAGKEGFQRMNYLYQVSNILATQSVAGNISSSINSNLLVNISRKTVQRMEIDMKRTICKSCRCLLLSGITCKVRINKKKMVYKCLKCSNSKILDIKNKSFLPWSQREESVVEVIDFGKNREIQVDNHKKIDRNIRQSEFINIGKTEIKNDNKIAERHDTLVRSTNSSQTITKDNVVVGSEHM